MIEFIERKIKKFNSKTYSAARTRRELWKIFFSENDALASDIKTGYENIIGHTISSGELANMVADSYKILSTRLHVTVAHYQHSMFNISIPYSNSHSLKHCELIKQIGKVFYFNCKIANIQHLNLSEDDEITFK